MYLVFDLESKNIFDEVENRDHKKLGISYLAFYRSDTDKIEGYFEDDVIKFKQELETAKTVIGYNIIDFDFPVLESYFPVNQKAFIVCDLYQLIYKKHNVYLKLDNITEATLNASKIAHGLDAIRFYREGNFAKLKEYCDMDVEITTRLYKYIKENKFFYYTDGLGNKTKLELDIDEELKQLPKPVTAPLDDVFGGLF